MQKAPFILAGLIAAAVAQPALAADLSQHSVNAAQFQGSNIQPGKRNPVMLRAQVLLDRAHVSPGVIDGRMGENTSRALAAYEEMHGLKADGKLDSQVWQLLTKGNPPPALTSYTIKKDDVDGPFIKKIPAQLQAEAKLDHLSYTGPQELLAAKFHMDQDLLAAINPKADLSKAGTKITVANVRGNKPDGTIDHVEANKKREAVIAYGKDGKVIAYYPATVGSKDLPSPSGRVKVVHVVSHPKYYYHPSLDFKGVPNKTIVVPSGPNNPVGLMWIDLSKPNYGIHGDPHPADVGKQMSHGCVRLTNWDAVELGKMIEVGTKVIFTQAKQPLPNLEAGNGGGKQGSTKQGSAKQGSAKTKSQQAKSQ